MIIRRPNKNRRASTITSGRQYAVAVEGTLITFECKASRHRYGIEFGKGPVHRRMSPDACRMMASWWSEAKDGCIGECPYCERAKRKELKAMTKTKAKQVERGTLFVNGSNLGPAERDPKTGVIEQGPHVTARAKKRTPKAPKKERTIFDRPIMLHVCKDGTVSYRDASKHEKVFNGAALPVFSVDTVDEAEQIQVRFCRKMYSTHPLMPGKPWYIFNDFTGDVDDLDFVTASFANFYAKQTGRAEDRDLAAKVRNLLNDRHKRLLADEAVP